MSEELQKCCFDIDHNQTKLIRERYNALNNREISVWLSALIKIDLKELKDFP